MPTFNGNINQKKMKCYIHNNNFTIYPRQQVATSCLYFSGGLRLTNNNFSPKICYEIL